MLPGNTGQVDRFGSDQALSSSHSLMLAGKLPAGGSYRLPTATPTAAIGFC